MWLVSESEPESDFSAHLWGRTWGCMGLGRAEEPYSQEVDLTPHHMLSPPSFLHGSQTHP